jgi:hypothetical protein
LSVERSGYEDNITIDDPRCTRLLRTSPQEDYSAGCLAVTHWQSTYPDAYLDPNSADSGSRFTFGTGFVNAAAIVEGTTYVNRFWFESPRYINHRGSIARHSGAITYKGFIGIRYAGSSNGFCHFNVDQTPLSEGIFR